MKQAFLFFICIFHPSMAFCQWNISHDSMIKQIMELHEYKVEEKEVGTPVGNYYDRIMFVHFITQYFDSTDDTSKHLIKDIAKITMMQTVGSGCPAYDTNDFTIFYSQKLKKVVSIKKGDIDWLK